MARKVHSGLNGIMGEGSFKDVNIGTMKVKRSPMTVMLVFGKEDAQCRALHTASESRGYQCDVTTNTEGVVELYMQTHHDVMFIDLRSSASFDGEALCRSIRATDSKKHATIVAITNRTVAEIEEPSILPLLNAGFNRCISENTSISHCTNELLMLEHNDVRAKLLQQASGALWTAVENVSDAVEILSDTHQLQYVNPAHERLLGYTCEDNIGQNVNDLFHCDRTATDQQDNISSAINKGKSWEGVVHVKRKAGDIIANHCRIVPVTSNGGGIRHLVVLRGTQETDRYNLAELTQLAGGTHRLEHPRLERKVSPFRRGSADSYVAGFPRRRESIAKIHSMTIEAPITKVINMINAAQENSSGHVAQALETVLEILKGSELYSPYLGGQQVKQDQMTSELVEGLMQGMKRRQSSIDGSAVHRANICPQNPVPTNTLSTITSHIPPPNVQTLLTRYMEWDFQILELEAITNKRTIMSESDIDLVNNIISTEHSTYLPNCLLSANDVRPLLYLGMQIFKHFQVAEFLKVNEYTVWNWLQMVEANYHTKNYYHNSTHAADVLHATAYFLQKERSKRLFDSLDQVCSLLAAVIHDLDHPGYTNAYLINSNNELAVLYNDVAVLESHHISLAFHLTAKDERTNIFKHLNRDDYREVRAQMIDMVLATEMTKHFEHLNKFIGSVTKTIMRAEDDTTSLVNGMGSPSRCSSPTSIMEDLSSVDNRTLIKRMLIKCADIANPLRPLPLCKQWAVRIAREYCGQTDEERKRGLPVVMPTFDRKTCNLPKSQIGFIDLFIHDMFDAWHTFCDTPELLEELQKNYDYWKTQDMDIPSLLSDDYTEHESDT